MTGDHWTYASAVRHGADITGHQWSRADLPLIEALHTRVTGRGEERLPGSSAAPFDRLTTCPWP